MGESFGGGVRAGRKQHQCEWCQQLTLVGERHCWWTWQDEGTVSTLRCHEECEGPLRNSVAIDEFCNEGHGRGEECTH